MPGSVAFLLFYCVAHCFALFCCCTLFCVNIFNFNMSADTFILYGILILIFPYHALVLHTISSQETRALF
jgi:hypothetical protein